MHFGRFWPILLHKSVLQIVRGVLGFLGRAGTMVLRRATAGLTLELLTLRTERLRGARDGRDRRRTRHELGEPPQVLRDRRQRELELSSARAAKA